jgi:anaerobic magnesium-protoporphyrin IX monomethyl ester cyclase
MSLDGPVLLIAPEIVNPRAMPCVGLGYIGAYLASQGVQVRIVDSQFTKEDPVPLLRASKPTLVAIGVDSRTIHRGLRIAALAKRYGHTTLLGGLHVSLIKQKILDWPEVDYGIVGDGEVPTFQLLEMLEGGRPISAVSGLVYRTPEGQRRNNPNITEAAHLDSLPFPDYRLAGIHNFPLYPLVTSRDCPYKCAYCTVGNISHGRFRARSAESAVDELIVAKERYGIRSFVVVDENFSFDMDRAVRFCELLIEKKVGLRWTAFEGIRADCLTPQILDLLKRSGCSWVFFGIESAENAILRKVIKGSRFQHIERAVSLSREHGMRIGGFLIVGLPDSTFGTDLKTIEWATSTLDRMQFWMSTPYYGTSLHNWVVKYATLLREPVGDNIVNSLSTQPFYEMPQYRAKQIKQAHTIASLRTGVNYFFNYLDHEAYNRLRWSDRDKSAHQRRLISHAARWDPSWLTKLVPERRGSARRRASAAGRRRL